MVNECNEIFSGHQLELVSDVSQTVFLYIIRVWHHSLMMETESEWNV
jgi:hypothetical protein